jgi:hypothetical protein
MTGAEIIAAVRGDYLDDAVAPYLFSNALLGRYLNKAEGEASRRANLIVDKDTANDSIPLPLCSLSLVAETSIYSISKKILRIIKCIPSWNSVSLEQKTEGWLDEIYPNWRTDSGAPIYFLAEKGEITLVPKPVANETQSVSGITRVGTTATVTLSSHGYTTGKSVAMAGADQSEYNGTFVITKIDDSSFSYTVSGAPATPATGTLTATLIDTVTLEVTRLPVAEMTIGTKSVTGITRVAAVANVNLPSHGYSTGDTITHTGADQAEYNVSAVITVIDGDNYSYPVSGTPATPATGTLEATTSESPEIPEEYHEDLAYYVCHLAYLKQDAETEDIARSDKFEDMFAARFGPKISARTESKRIRKPRNRGLRAKSFGFS